MKHIIISLFSLLLLITSNNVSNNKSTFDTKDNLKQTQVLSRQNGIGSEYIDSNIEDTPYDGKQVSFTITVISDDSIINSNFLNDGMELLNQPIFNENKEATLNYNISKLQGSSNISISLSENNILSLNVYAICTEYGTFLNTDSYQMAEENYYAFLLLNEYITEEEYSDYINDFSSTTIIEDVSEVGNVDNHSNSEIKRRKNTTTYAYGYIQWIDDEYNLEHPLVGIRVNIYDKDPIGYTFLGSTYTNNDGYYSFAFSNETLFENGGYDIFIRVYSESANSKVVKSLFFDNSYYVQSKVTNNVSSGHYYDKSMTINMGNNTGKAIQIAQALVFGDEYVKTMNDSNGASFVTAKYPANGSYYNFFGIHYAKKAYKFWDVILHEYGHHLQTMLKIENNPGGDHYINGDCISSRGKSKGIRLAWGEAWPTVFALQVTDYFSNLLPNIRYISDEFYDSYGDAGPWNFNVETAGYQYLGEGCEGDIIAVLYDLYDNSNEYFDNFSIGHQNLWNIMKECKAKTFSEFANYIYSNSVLDVNLFGKLLSHYGVVCFKRLLNHLGSRLKHIT